MAVDSFVLDCLFVSRTVTNRDGDGSLNELEAFVRK